MHLLYASCFIEQVFTSSCAYTEAVYSSLHCWMQKYTYNPRMKWPNKNHSVMAHTAVYPFYILTGAIFTESNLQRFEVMALHRPDFIRTKTVVDGTVLEQVSNFEYLGCNVSFSTNNDVVVHKFNLMCGTTTRKTIKKHVWSFPRWWPSAHFSMNLKIGL